MSRNSKFIIAKISFLIGVSPFIVQGHEYGPDVRRASAPADQGNCLDSGCHSGNLNPAGGSVKILTPGGATTYTPGGAKIRLMVQISDAAKGKFGFELSARQASNPGTLQAGDFATSDALTQILCDDSSTKSVSGCPARFPVQFIEHTLAGYQASTAGGYTYQFDWTPPATNVGNVTLYVSSVAGPAGAPNERNANVYTTNIALTPAAADPNAPAITNGGVVPVYSTSTTVQPGAWFSVYGSNLAAATTIWNGDFPTQLGGTTVTVSGKPAYLWFVSSGQINAQAPDDTQTGTVPVVVKTAAGTSTTTITLGTASPSFLLLADAKHATGIILTLDGSGSQGAGVYDLLGPSSAGAGFRAAKKGENVAIYAVGFGPLQKPVPAGAVYTGPAIAALTTPTVTLGGVPVQVDFAGVVGAGLYQLNFKIPANAASGEQVLSANVGGLLSQSNITIPIQ
jgi:uncharacterized protein (TIGR03437 family)